MINIEGVLAFEHWHHDKMTKGAAKKVVGGLLGPSAYPHRRLPNLAYWLP